MKIVIQTQNRENYGAHDWDGKGECPQYWKFKGGETYVLHDVDVDDAQQSDYWDRIETTLESSSNYCEEYIIGVVLVDEVDFVLSNHIESYESAIDLIELADIGFTARQIVVNDGMWRNELARKFTTWTIVDGERQDFECSYEFINGKILPSAEASEYLEQLNPAVSTNILNN